MVSNEKERYSFSKLSTFHTCKLDYYQRYILKRKGEGNCYSSYGSLMHSILERYAKGELALNELVDTFEWEFESSIPEAFPEKLFGKKYDMKGNYYKQGVEFLKNFKGYSDCNILGVEKSFDVPIDDWTFTGIADLIFEDSSSTLVVQDYKSKAGFSSKSEKAKYARQPYLYSMWVKEEYGKYPDVLRFLMFRKNITIDIPFDKTEFKEAVGWAKDTVSEIRSCWSYDPTCDSFYGNNLCNHRSYCESRVN